MIETLLRKSPAPQAPADLAQMLISDIHLPRAVTARSEWKPPQSSLRRWLPAISFAAFLITCLMVVGIQFGVLQDLRNDGSALRAQTQNLESLRQSNLEVQRLRKENSELDRLQKESSELQRLRDEMAQLRTQIGDLPQLRAKNSALVAANKAAPDAPKDFFAEEKEKSERIVCVNNLKQIDLALRIWAGDNGDYYPVNFISMTNELSTWNVLHCPSDTRVTSSWMDVRNGNVSYPLYSDGCKDTDNPDIIVAECPIHHNVALLDGSVQMLSPTSYAEKIHIVNGRKVLDR